jgi:uncharacterized protein YndB with AHSA1/START domain
MDNQAIKIERVFDSPVEKVWAALTDNTQIKQWYFDFEEFKPEVGFEFRFYGGHEDGIQYQHVCQIKEVIENRKLAYSWRYDGYQGDSLVSFELFPEGDKTRLVLTHEGIETFDASNKDFAKGNFVEGWTYIVNTGLKEYLDK